MAKILPSPGLSSHPLSLLDRLFERYRDVRYNRSRKRLVLNPFRYWRQRQQRRAVERLVCALEAGVGGSPLAGGAPLQIESLDATMERVVFDDKKLRL